MNSEQEVSTSALIFLGIRVATEPFQLWSFGLVSKRCVIRILLLVYVETMR